MKIFLLPALILLLFNSCGYKNSKQQKELILHADREAPLGWLHLQLYADSSFEFHSKGIRMDDKYVGTFSIIADTLKLSFRDSVPKAISTKLLFTKTGLVYLGSPGGLVYQINKISPRY
ncbi:hypothetical protein DN068_16065 [Taibaiella soli]|uniref:Uncharacterized protein n=2 Tax=Taibaiella soli TaxID=1649169 RepID=A0A2W2B5V4_9BACT|nr:hypothetical protein DN068_16065 [Taibaiella soli]